MEVAGSEPRSDALRLEFYDDPLFHDGRGELSWAALAVLADLALGGVTRHKGGPTRRPATVHLAMQMSGVAVVRTQILRADGKLVLEATTQHAAG